MGTKTMLCAIILALSLTGCYNTLKYGWLPGGDYEYFQPLNPVNLQGEKYRLEIVDDREGFQVSCADIPLDRNTELEGATGFEYFSNYVRAMIEANNGVIDPGSDNAIRVQLKGLSAEIIGFGYGRVFGLIEFNASFSGVNKTYCSSLKDGDEGTPLGKYSLATRKGAFRAMASASTRQALEQLMSDLLKAKKKHGIGT